MGFISNLFDAFKNNKEPSNPNEFVKKFLKDIENGRVQLEMIYNNQVILQVDSLRFVPSWFKIQNPKII